jgi:hypothetical protein
METSNKTKIKFIKSDSVELETLVTDLFDIKEGLQIKDPNLIIADLEFIVDHSFTRGSFGDFHMCYNEYIIKNSPLSVLLIFVRDWKLVSELLKTQKITVLKGQFAQYFKTFEGKDSNSVTRYTFSDFHLGHMMVGFESNDTYTKQFLNTEETCGEFEVQHKSSQYSSRSEDKYSQGFKEKITNCSLKEMKQLDKKIEDMSEYKHIKTNATKKSKR